MSNGYPIISQSEYKNPPLPQHLWRVGIGNAVLRYCEDSFAKWQYLRDSCQEKTSWRHLCERSSSQRPEVERKLHQSFRHRERWAIDVHNDEISIQILLINFPINEREGVLGMTYDTPSFLFDFEQLS